MSVSIKRRKRKSHLHSPIERFVDEVKWVHESSNAMVITGLKMNSPLDSIAIKIVVVGAKDMKKRMAEKEFTNLKKLERAGVFVPHPIHHEGNFVVMGLVGDDGIPAPSLIDTEVEDPGECFDKIVDHLRDSYQNAGLVHGNLKPEHILIWEGNPWLISWGWAVPRTNPLSITFLSSNVRELVDFFKRKYGLEREPEEVMEAIIG